MAHILVQVENTVLPTKYDDKLYYDLSNNGNYYLILDHINIIVEFYTVLY